MLHALPLEILSMILEYVCACIARLHDTRLTYLVLPKGRSEKPLLSLKSLALGDYTTTLPINHSSSEKRG